MCLSRVGTYVSAHEHFRPGKPAGCPDASLVPAPPQVNKISAYFEEGVVRPPPTASTYPLNTVALFIGRA